MTARETGDWGESKACEFLEKNGLHVLKRNFHARVGEIDIIAKDSDETVFVEVKTRLSKSYGTPGEFVDFQKQERIIKTALFYLGTDDVNMCFDVVEVMYKMAGDCAVVTEINHIKNAF